MVVIIGVGWQEVARILQDQVRICDEQMVEALHEADSKHAEKEKAWSEKLAAALAEITIKDSLVKQHIKVAEEAVVGKTISPTLVSFSLALSFYPPCTWVSEHSQRGAMLELEDHVCLESETFELKHENEVSVGRSDCQLSQNSHHLVGSG